MNSVHLAAIGVKFTARIFTGAEDKTCEIREVSETIWEKFNLWELANYPMVRDSIPSEKGKI